MIQLDEKLNTFFTSNLLQWNESHNRREMPWKYEKDPYKIWISEIILQQTRVEQGLDYYNRFVKKYPNIKKLAAADDSEVFKMWEGLGYYSRCKNLIETARKIADELNGKFPNSYDDILKLKGIGPYTAAAIASFAYNLPYAVVDGNVMRVLARFFGIATPIDSTEGKKIFSHLAQTLISHEFAGKYNQAIMDFGATVCKPQSPLCEVCPFSKKCIANQQQSISILPVKEKTIIKKDRWLYYFIVEIDNKIYIREREGKDIWQNLHEFVLVEFEKYVTPDKLLKNKNILEIIDKPYELLNVSEIYHQKLTHQNINGIFIHLKIKQPLQTNQYKLVTKKAIKKLAFPRLITQYFLSGRMD